MALLPPWGWWAEAEPYPLFEVDPLLQGQRVGSAMTGTMLTTLLRRFMNSMSRGLRLEQDTDEGMGGGAWNRDRNGKGAHSLPGGSWGEGPQGACSPRWVYAKVKAVG